LKPSLTVAVLGAVVGAGFVLATLQDLFAGSIQYVAQIVLLMLGYGLLFVGKGVLAGSRRFADVGWLLIIETVARLVAGVVAIQLFASAESFGWAMVLGGFSVLGMRWWRHDKGQELPSVASPTNFHRGYVGGTAASQVLLGAAPIAVALLGGGEELQSIVFATFTLYRAPLTLIFSLQGRILPYLVGVAGGPDSRRLGRIAVRVVIVGAVMVALGGVLGYLAGPQVVALLFPDEFAPTAVVAGLTAAGVMAAATAQVAGQVLVAEARTSRLALAWSGGLVAGVAALFVIGGEPDVRVAMAFAIGEIVALALMAVLAIGGRGSAEPTGVLRPE
jgi:O-antigen/teichoic acid export membrane protein